MCDAGHMSATAQGSMVIIGMGVPQVHLGGKRIFRIPALFQACPLCNGFGCAPHPRSVGGVSTLLCRLPANYATKVNALLCCISEALRNEQQLADNSGSEPFQKCHPRGGAVICLGGGPVSQDFPTP